MARPCSAYCSAVNKCVPLLRTRAPFAVVQERGFAASMPRARFPRLDGALCVIKVKLTVNLMISIIFQTRFPNFVP